MLRLEPQTELCKGMTNLYDLSGRTLTGNTAAWTISGDCIQLGKSGSAQFTCDGVKTIWLAITDRVS
ncbi:MAG: hypothetical protein ACLS3C_03425 [Oscillospiraceae bacterium]